MAGITLAQLAQVETSSLRKGVLMNLLRDSNILKIVPFQTVNSLKVQALRWETLPNGGTWRRLNEGYTSDESGNIGELWESLYAFGGDITYDRVLKKLGNVVQDPVVLQTEMKLKVMSLNYNNVFINGDHGVDPDQFEGLKKRVSAMPARQTVYFAASTAAGLDPTASTTNARTFLDKWDEMWYKCHGGAVDAIFCNEGVLWGVIRVLRYLQISGASMLDTTKDVFGREVQTFKGKPFIDVGLSYDETTEILSNTEAGGTGSANTTSVYMVNFDSSDGLVGIELEPLKAYDPLTGGEMETKPSRLLRIDWWNGLASFGSYCITRGRNLLAPASWT